MSKKDRKRGAGQNTFFLGRKVARKRVKRRYREGKKKERWR